MRTLSQVQGEAMGNTGTSDPTKGRGEQAGIRDRKPRTPKQRWFVLLVDTLGFEEFQTADHTGPGGGKYDAKTVAAAGWAAASGLDEGRVLGWAEELGKAFPKAQRVDRWVLVRRLAELDFGPRALALRSRRSIGT